MTTVPKKSRSNDMRGFVLMFAASVALISSGRAEARIGTHRHHEVSSRFGWGGTLNPGWGYSFGPRLGGSGL
jgi:hypothetical protein